MAESSIASAEKSRGSFAHLRWRGQGGLWRQCEVPRTPKDMKGFLPTQKRKETKITNTPSVRIAGRVPHAEVG